MVRGHCDLMSLLFLQSNAIILKHLVGEFFFKGGMNVHLESMVNWSDFGDKSNSDLTFIPLLWLLSGGNGWREFLQVWHRRPLGLEDELIRSWWSKVKITAASQNAFLAITQEFFCKLWQTFTQMSNRIIGENASILLIWCNPSFLNPQHAKLTWKVSFKLRF